MQWYLYSSTNQILCALRGGAVGSSASRVFLSKKSSTPSMYMFSVCFFAVITGHKHNRKWCSRTLLQFSPNVCVSLQVRPMWSRQGWRATQDCLASSALRPFSSSCDHLGRSMSRNVLARSTACLKPQQFDTTQRRSEYTSALMAKREARLLREAEGVVSAKLVRELFSWVACVVSFFYFLSRILSSFLCTSMIVHARIVGYWFEHGHSQYKPHSSIQPMFQTLASGVQGASTVSLLGAGQYMVYFGTTILDYSYGRRGGRRLLEQ